MAERSMNTTKLIAQVRADIAACKAMPNFGPETSIERIKIINATQRSFTMETLEVLIEGLESALRKITELESRMVTVKMPVAATAGGHGYLLKAQEACECSIIPEGYALVPLEPTRQMMSQGHFAMAGTDRGKFRRIYQAMIAAAPK